MEKLNNGSDGNDFVLLSYFIRVVQALVFLFLFVTSLHLCYCPIYGHAVDDVALWDANCDGQPLSDVCTE